MDGCLQAAGELELEGIHAVSLAYEYLPDTDNRNGRTLAGFSQQAEKKMGLCAACPYVDYQKYLDYFGAPDYGHQWISAALERRSPTLSNGSVDFGTLPVEVANRAAQIGTTVLNIWMYVVREFEDALDDCVEGCATDQCNSDKVSAWDEGVAFYTGSLEGVDGSGDGNLLYALADDLCQDFKTCGDNGDSTEGTSKVNTEIFKLFNLGASMLLREECVETRTVKEHIANWMKVPLIQATLRAAYATPSDQSQGDMLAYASTILPYLHSCSPMDASTVFSAMTNTDTSNRFAIIKEALERHYECMGVTCEEIGGLIDTTTGISLPGAESCTSPSSGTNLLVPIIAGVGGLVLCSALVWLFFGKRPHDY
jgi:hypothetical protein